MEASRFSKVKDEENRRCQALKNSCGQHKYEKPTNYSEVLFVNEAVIMFLQSVGFLDEIQLKMQLQPPGLCFGPSF